MIGHLLLVGYRNTQMCQVVFLLLLSKRAILRCVRVVLSLLQSVSEGKSDVE